MDDVEINGNPAIVSIGCTQCPKNIEFSIEGMTGDGLSAFMKVVGKVIECPHCKGKWMWKSMQVRGIVEEETEEWRITPMYVPILDTFTGAGITLLETPCKLMDEGE